MKKHVLLFLMSLIFIWNIFMGIFFYSEIKLKYGIVFASLQFSLYMIC